VVHAVAGGDPGLLPRRHRGLFPYLWRGGSTWISELLHWQLAVFGGNCEPPPFFPAKLFLLLPFFSRARPGIVSSGAFF
jgi:hypothetical protein